MQHQITSIRRQAREKVYEVQLFRYFLHTAFVRVGDSHKLRLLPADLERISRNFR
jgi:hypothetical protein